ncbi:glycosyltransferase [Nafulsella turpanensis]|uniref:glycosyltransferase n=1 Tax=Nafulsella turpanensis TaxID=1265690 RepID=UPI000346B2F6|nr:glycosyltransferase [Nafulsella turpanensis]
MNIFIIPSWYPSAEQPHAGIFTKEQAEALAHIFPTSSFALSSWGSHEEDLLLWAREPFSSLVKVGKFFFKKPAQKQLAPNLLEYYSPALAWSRKFFSGNIRNIIKVNEKHLLDFMARCGKVDVLHAHSAYPGGWVAKELGRKYKIPYLITEHMSPFPFKSFLSRNGKLSPYLQKPYRQAYATIVVSPQQQETLAEWGIPGLRHIPNLVNENFFRPAPKSKEASTAFTFFTLGRQEPQKGIPFLLEAFQQYSSTQPNSQLRIGGDGSREKEYQQMAHQLGISDKVAWLGGLSRKEALKEFQQCQVFVLPSLHENLPLVLIEAIACGKPVIGTRCGGPESIINEKNGLLVEAGNAEALALALAGAQQHFARYNEQEIRNDFCSRYSRQVVCRQIMEVYEEAKTKSGRDF